MDIVGVGALNVDYIALEAGAGERIAQVVPGLEWNAEHPVDEQILRAATLAAGAVTAVLGGSAFNTVGAVARTRNGLSLGYVGVAGRTPPGAPSPIGALDELGIDRRHVFVDDRHLCGVCLSFTERGDRTLLTHPGANRHLYEHLDRHRIDVVEYLAGSRLVHVTSLLDPQTPGRLLEVLTAAKTLNPDLRLSVDPGHVWAFHPTPEIEGILAIADYLLLNEREFGSLEPSPGTVVVVKSSDVIRIHHDGRVATRTQVPLTDDEIGDATGAGDAFAAGLLITVLDDDFPGADLDLDLAVDLARTRLQRF